MATEHAIIDTELNAWMSEQHVFFVATAPLGESGKINCSPKGMDTLRVIDEKTVAYLDLTGSGIETVAHLRENARIVIMMCAFEGRPRILRLHGMGEVLERGSAAYDEMIHRFPTLPGARAIVRVAVHRVSDSCGYGVPLYSYKGERDALVRWAQTKGDQGVARYQEQHNTTSLDGLRGLTDPTP